MGGKWGGLLLKITVPVVHDLVGDNTLEAARCGYQSDVYKRQTQGNIELSHFKIFVSSNC